MTLDTSDTQSVQLAKPPVVVQILAIICFTGFAIPVSIVSMVKFGLVGLLLAAFLGYQWSRLVGIGTDARLASAVKILKPHVDEAPKSSGNASFDAYRDKLMQRLEQEQTSFEGFLTRLRDAKDKTEFDSFLTERERHLNDQNGPKPA